MTLSKELDDVMGGPGLRECRCCKRQMDASCFCSNRARKDGKHIYCRECTAEKDRAYRSSEKGVLREKRRQASERHKQQRKAVNRKYRQSERGKQASLNHVRQFRKRYPEKVRVHQQVKRAIDAGILIRKPCAVCSTTALVHAHHEDYSKPLSVKWLCREHHAKEHNNGNR